jgi:hypothetical protein
MQKRPLAALILFQYAADRSNIARCLCRFRRSLRSELSQNLGFSVIKTYLNAGKSVDVAVEFIDNFSNLQAIGDGEYDRYLLKFGALAKDDGRTINIRPLHEFNGKTTRFGLQFRRYGACLPRLQSHDLYTSSNRI